MKRVIVDENLVAMCGLYCGACRRYLFGGCKGCKENVKATWCKVRTCCFENNFTSCAECIKFSKLNDCKKFNNIFAKIFSLIFKSDRRAGILRIKEVGRTKFAEEMATKKQHAVLKKRRFFNYV